MITVTDTAAAKIRSLLDAEGGEKAGLRVAVTGGGCSGFQYNLELIVYFETSTSPEQEEFNTTRNDQGLWAALAWRTPCFETLTASYL